MTPASSNFVALKAEWPDAHEAATRAEAFAHADARTACFHARRALELTVRWLYRCEVKLRLPYQDNLSALIHEPTFKQVAGEAVFNKARVIVTLGNRAVHSHRRILAADALAAVRELFHIGYWLAHTYARGAKPAPGLAFNSDALPKTTPLPPQTLEQLQRLETQLRERDEKLSTLLADKTALDAELTRLRAEVAVAKEANAATPDTHDYSEAETRDYFIDLLLKEAGWPLDQRRDREFEVSGMPNTPGNGFVDYVLWGDDGKPLALVEAKRTRKSAAVGQQQAKLYADCLEKQFGRRPVIFYSNGYEHWLWDDASYPPRPVQGFLKKAELELLIQRRTSRKPLATAKINEAIVGRYYQTRAIRRIAEAFEKDHDRKTLVVMATGGGKTRTVVALCDLLMRCNWVKRALFLCDRVALVKQAINKGFKAHLPESSPVNLLTEKNAEGRVFVSTYPTMMGLIDETHEGQRRFGVGHFDLIIIDEAHRSVYQKYGAIFRYFDALLVGLTATPRDEIDRDTYGLFELEKGVPTDAYDLADAVADKFLVPARAVSVPLKFQREGIRYDDLSEEEQAQWDEAEWDEESGVPAQVDPEGVNKWLFNQDTVDKVLAHLMTHGQKVAGGDRLGKTIIFAKNQKHAEFIAERFDANYPHHKGAFARVVHCDLPYAQSLIDDFSVGAKAPHIAISVDMLDTGIDVPEVVNLVFFKLVRSKTKFWQMVGRGTRLCPDLFGPGKPKEFFSIFDFCQNLEFFQANPEATAGSLGESLGRRLFKARLEIIGVVEQAEPGAVRGSATAEAELAHEIRELLRTEVAAMNVENFIVRPQRRLVERFARAEAWTALDVADRGELARHVAGLPTELEAEDEEAKRFDLLLLNLQLAVLRAEPAFERLSRQVMAIAGLLEEKSAIPMIAKQLVHIQEIQTPEWWRDITVAMLEQTRKRLRDLVKLIDRRQRKPIYTDFEDEMGEGNAVELGAFLAADDFEKFRDKARMFLRRHEDDLVIQKLRMNVPMTPLDLAELERMLAASGVATEAHLTRAKAESEGLGLFVRTLVGLERDAAKTALNAFTAGRTLTANQIEFVSLVVDYLTAHGAMKPELLYESPFTDINPHGPDGVFNPRQVDELIETLAQVRGRAIA
ncbi:MAG: DEAD/DEAH box helicase family protein [Opitutaceae bacterium]|nr:DEAD/DEAH box helicase family protein [Opitutaceae bacterium]